VSVRSRVAFATGVAGLAGATLMFSGRYDGSIALALIFVFAARSSVAWTVLEGGPVLAGRAERSLARQMWFAPAWALVAAAGAVRSGSTSLADIRGANAVAGLALARGSTVSVAGAWLALAAGVIAIVNFSPIGAETASVTGATGLIVPPVPLRRLEAAGIVAQAALVVTLFAGPQITGGIDAAWWVAGVAAIAAIAWRVRQMNIRDLSWIATAAAAAGLALVIAGGGP